MTTRLLSMLQLPVKPEKYRDVKMEDIYAVLSNPKAGIRLLILALVHRLPGMLLMMIWALCLLPAELLLTGRKLLFLLLSNKVNKVMVMQTWVN